MTSAKENVVSLVRYSQFVRVLVSHSSTTKCQSDVRTISDSVTFSVSHETLTSGHGRASETIFDFIRQKLLQVTQPRRLSTKNSDEYCPVCVMNGIKSFEV
jgi:hypothetical protein